MGIGSLIPILLTFLRFGNCASTRLRPKSSVESACTSHRIRTFDPHFAQLGSSRSRRSAAPSDPQILQVNSIIKAISLAVSTRDYFSAILEVLWLLPSASRMRLFTPTQSRRLNEVLGFLFLGAGLLVLLSFASFHPSDPSWDTVSEAKPAQNLIGPTGAWFSDFFLQTFGLGCFVLPV